MKLRSARASDKTISIIGGFVVWAL